MYPVEKYQNPIYENTGYIKLKYRKSYLNINKYIEQNTNRELNEEEILLDPRN
jgi:hypothetical protein